MTLRACVFIVLLSFGAQDGFSQEEITPASLPDIPRFYFDALSFASEQSDVSRLDVYIEVPHEVLNFIKDDDVFRANYEVTLTIYDSTDRLVDEKWWKEKVETTNYDETVSPAASNLSQKSLLLSPGSYGVAVQVKDVETEKTSRLRRKVIVRDYFTPPFSISDVMLVSYLDTSAGKKVLFPNISGNVGNLKEGFHIFFEAYNPVGAESASVILDIRNVKGDMVQSDTFIQPLAVNKKSVIHPERTDRLIAGDYEMEVHAIPLGGKESERLKDLSANTSRLFVIRWRGMPVSITDLDLAIDQMQYVAGKDKLDEMKDAKPEDKKRLFEKFWRSKDPTPNTERNELMEEYYARVAYANKHFGHYIDGWKTDMGMVYIIFGAPNNIERHPFDIDAKPYEVWTYYELNREFIFVDATGFGDYRLQNPVWDLYRTRPR